jgi:hypothetical protein
MARRSDVAHQVQRRYFRATIDSARNSVRYGSCRIAKLDGLGHCVLRTIHSYLLCSLLAGSFPGIVFGSRIVVRVPETELRLDLATMLITVAGRLVL